MSLWRRMLGRGRDPAPPQTAAAADEGQLADRDLVLKALDTVIDPVSGRGLAEAGLVQGLLIRPGRASFMLEAPASQIPAYAEARDRAEAALLQVKGVLKAQVALTTKDPAPPGGARGIALDSTRPAAAPAPKRARPAPGDAEKPPHVRQAIAVASAKGGVGKSTVAVNLACAFARLGYRTGLLDADVYGPSAPILLGLTDRPEVDQDKRLIPLEAFGVRAVSIGLLVKEDAPMIWRGPMASSALTQLLMEVAWGAQERPLDLLLIDMPPGTGDIQLTLAQKLRLDGAVIVSTPQELALADVRRGVAMYARTNTPVLGIIENMAFFEDPTTLAPIEIFGRGGARAAAAQLGAPFLGEIPIDIALRAASDAGRPVTACAPETPLAWRFMAMAADIAERLKAGGAGRPPPRILEVD